MTDSLIELIANGRGCVVLLVFTDFVCLQSSMPATVLGAVRIMGEGLLVGTGSGQA